MKILFGSLYTFMIVSAVFGTAFAQTPVIGSDTGQTPVAQGGAGVTIPNPIGADNITDLFIMLIDILLIFAIPIIVFFIIYAGFMYVTAQGNTSQIENANRALLYAVIGGVIILGAKVLIEVIGGTVESFY